MRRLSTYLREHLVRGLATAPFPSPAKAWLPVPLFALFSLVVGFTGGLFSFALLRGEIVYLLPFTLFIFPSLLEEAFFRGVLIPRDILRSGWPAAGRYIGASTLLFVLWHPINALTINRGAAGVFLDPAFLAIVAALGLTCGFGYVISRSIWVPTIIHWLTVCVWVIFLGGRNMVLEL